MPIYKKEKDKQGKQWIYQINYTDITGNYKSKKSKRFMTKREAEKAETIFKSGIGENKQKSSITFNSIYEDYLTHKRKEVKIQTMIKIESQYRYISKYLGNIKIDRLTIKAYTQFKNELDTLESRGKPLSTVYKNKIHQLVKNMLLYTKKFHGTYSDAPEICGPFKNSNEFAKEQDFYTYDEYMMFRSNITSVVWIAFFDTLYYCGLRYGEANALKWSDIDFDKKQIKITKTVTTKIKGVAYHISTPKTKSSIRTLPIANTLLDSLKTLKNHYELYIAFSKNWFVFGGVKPLSDTTTTNEKNKYSELAHLRQIRLHDFRHSCASLLINSNANITVVAKYLGHSKIDMTLNTYSHMYKSKLDEVVDLINNL